MKKLLLIGGSATVLLLCILFGAFFAGPLLASAHGTQSAASTPAANSYCQQFLQDLAHRLNVPVTTFEQDKQAAREDVLAQMVKDGKLTQAQADKIKQRLETHTACANAGKGLGKQGRGILNSLFKKYQPALLNAVAQGLHLNASQLQADLHNGQTLSQVAQAQKISDSQLHTIVMNAVQSTLNQARQAGDITQVQATMFMQFLQKHPGLVNRILHHKLTKKA